MKNKRNQIDTTSQLSQLGQWNRFWLGQAIDGGRDQGTLVLRL